MKKIVRLGLVVSLLLVSLSPISEGVSAQDAVVQGVWNNFSFRRQAEDWSSAAKRFGGENGLVDLVVAQANSEGYAALPFPFESDAYLRSISEIDMVESYLTRFDLEGLKVILSIQPLKADVSQLISIILQRYGHHDSIIGINVDLEWKESGIINHVSNKERDEWLSKIKNYKSSLKLFLTYFGDYKNFPNDSTDLVILFDAENDTQTNILERYRKLAEHFSTVGIYTGYQSSVPPTASYNRIVSAVPKTEYIIQVSGIFSDKPVLIFELDNIQAGWLEYTTKKLIDLHVQERVPLLCGVIPYNLDNPDMGTGILLRHLNNLEENFDIFEIGQEGYTDDDSGLMKGKSYEEQKEIVEEGFRVLTSVGLRPDTFVPPHGSADETTVKVAEEIGFKGFVNLYENLRSDTLLVIDSWVSLTDVFENNTVIKTSDELMSEIDRTNEKVTIVLYEINDFQTNSQNKLVEFSNTLRALKNSGKYRFMTLTEYREILENNAEQEHPQTFIPIHWISVSICILAICIVILVYRTKKSSQTSMRLSAR